MATSIWSRKRDMLYLVFFAIHIPVMFLVDLTPFYPTALKPQFLTDIRTFYVNTYADQFFVSPPAWFNAYLYLELFYHIPLSTWAIGALLRDDPKIPIHLIVYATQTAVTTLTCIADYMSWTTVSSVQKLELGKLYVPYLALSVFMGVDMFGRLCSKVGGAAVSKGKKRA